MKLETWTWLIGLFCLFGTRQTEDLTFRKVLFLLAGILFFVSAVAMFLGYKHKKVKNETST